MKTKASIAVVLAGVLWGCITLFVRRLSAAGLTSMQIALARLAVSAVLFSLFLLIRDPSPDLQSSRECGKRCKRLRFRLRKVCRILLQEAEAGAVNIFDDD